MTLYPIHPIHDKALQIGREVIPIVCFPENVQMVWFRYHREYEYCGYATGDCAVAIRQDAVRLLKIVEVGELSGVAQAVCLHKIGAAQPYDPIHEALSTPAQ